MPRVDSLTPVYVHFMPETLEEGKLYISKEFDIAIHLCPCGCGHKIRLILDPMYGWILTEHPEGDVSFTPSVGNFQIPCKTHYFIQHNKIVWC